MKCRPHNDLHTEECIKEINPCTPLPITSGVTEVRAALVRIATLMLKVPITAIEHHLSPYEVKELLECYQTAKCLMPSKGAK